MTLYFLKNDNAHHCSVSGPAGVELLELAKALQEMGYHTIGYIEYQKRNWSFKQKPRKKDV